MNKLHGLLVALVVAWSASAGAAPTYKVKIQSTPPGASIYLESQPDKELGKTPATLRLAKGQLTLQIKLDGYESQTRTVVLRRAETFTFALVKKPEPATFSLEAAPGSEVIGATVKVNGQIVGQVPVKVALLQGRYLVEVTKDGFKTWTQWVDVQEAEKRSIVVSLVAEVPDMGSVLVSSNITGAEVYVDGRKIDTAPALVEKLAVGPHVVEVRAEGYVTRRQDVTIEGGKTSKVTLDLELDKATVAANTGTIQILAEPKGVEILVDGQSQGEAPVKVEGLAEGTHLIEGKKDGYDAGEQSLDIKKGEFKTIKLTLKEKTQPAAAGTLQVSSNIQGATVTLDGKEAGKTPLLQPNVLPGPHVVSVAQTGYEELYLTVEVKAGETTEVRADLKVATAPVKPEVKPETPATTTKTDEPAVVEEPEPRETLGLSSYGSQLVGVRNFTTDISAGFPYFLEARLTSGLWERGWFGIDAGVEFRSFFQQNEVGLHSNIRVLYYEPIAVSATFAIGGGGGPNSRETFYTNLGVSFSFWFKRLVTVTGRAYANIYVDDVCSADPADDDPDSVCAVKQSPTADELDQIRQKVVDGRLPSDVLTKDFRDSLRGTFSGVRFLLAAILEVPIHRNVNLFAIFEGAPGQGNARWALRDLFSSVMPEDDPALYGRIGATFKF